MAPIALKINPEKERKEFAPQSVGIYPPTVDPIPIRSHMIGFVDIVFVV